MSNPGLSWLTDPRSYLQNAVGAPVNITSGLRSPEHNAAVGGVPNSDHLNPGAYDFVPQGMSMQDAFAALQNSGAPIKQALNEGNHIHVAFNQPQTPVDPLDAALAAQSAGPQAQQQQQSDPLDAALAQQAAAKPQPADLPRTGVKSGPPGNVNWLDTALHYATGGLMDKGDALVQTLGSLPGGVQVGDFGTRYGQNLTNIRNEYGGYAADNPTANKAAHAAGVIAPMLVGGAGAPSLLGSVMKNGAMGAAYGFGGTDDSSLSGDLGAAGMGGLFGGALGAAGHGVGAIAGNAVGSVADRIAGSSQTRGQRLAAGTIMDSLAQHGIAPGDLTAQLAGATKPLTPMDIGGENSALARQGRLLTVLPGQPGKDITDFLNNRQTGAPGIPGQRGRVLSDISQMAPNTDTYGTQADLSSERSVNADPLYKKAFASAGVGPVDYEAARNDLIGATAQKGAIAKQIKSIEQNNSGALASRGAAGADIRSNYMDLHQQLQESEAARLAAASKFQNAQAGIEAMQSNQPLTDQRLAEFLKDPDIKSGMQQGLNIQRRQALAKGEEFDPNAYAITGYDDKGLPQVGPVPTWRTLHAGREGLDAILNSYRNPITLALPDTKLVNSFKDLRKAYSDHLQMLNPELKAADAAWSGPSQQKDAINLGGDFLKADPEQITQATGRMNSGTLPYYRMGAGRSLRDVANDTRDNNNIPLRLNSDQTTRDQIGAAFGPDNAAQFAGNMNLESQMAKTRQFVTGGSNTANKLADMQKSGMLPVLQDAISGALAGGVHGALVLPAVNLARRASMNWAENLLNNGDKNQELAKVLTATGPDAAAKIQDLLAAAQRRHRTAALGKMIGNAVGRGAIAGSLPQLMAPAANN